MAIGLMILYSKDAEEWAFKIRHHYSPLIATDVNCLDDLCFPLRPSKVHVITKSRKTILLISPAVLDFLIDQREDALGLFQMLKPSNTIGAFCCGADPTDVSLLHKGVLSDYEQWTTMTLDKSAEFCRYAQYELDPLINRYGLPMDDQRPTKCESDDHHNDDQGTLEIILLPKKVSMEEKCIYLILNRRIGENQEISVTLEKDGTTQACLNRINPFVFSFLIPDHYTEYPGVIGIRIHDDNTLLHESILDFEFVQQVSDDSLQDRSEGEFSDEQEDNSVEPMYENTPKTPLTLRMTSRDGSCRSVSLPSLLSPLEPVQSNLRPIFMEGDEVCYIDMRGRPCTPVQALKPHERLLQTMLEAERLKKEEDFENLFANDIYQTMERGSGRNEVLIQTDEVLSDLGRSQQELVELLRAFKRGVKTISEVEHLFQEWHQRHRDSLREKERVVHKHRKSVQSGKKVQRSQTFGLPDLKSILSLNPMRKLSKAKSAQWEHDKTHTSPLLPPSNDSKKNDSKGDTRIRPLSKISNSSNSSICSACSESSIITGSYGRTTDSGTLSDTCEYGHKKAYTTDPVALKQDDQSTVWFRPLSPDLLRRRKAEEAPQYLMPLRPPPLPQALSDSCLSNNGRTKSKPLQPPLSPDYVEPNTYLKVPPLPTRQNMKDVDISLQVPCQFNIFRKVETPDVPNKKINLPLKDTNPTCDFSDNELYEILNPSKEVTSKRPELMAYTQKTEPIYLELI